MVLCVVEFLFCMQRTSQYEASKHQEPQMVDCDEYLVVLTGEFKPSPWLSETEAM